MKEIIFFSNNKDKINEINKLCKKISLNILSLNDFKKIDSPEETGLSFNENAKIKSIYGLGKFDLPCFADDSGICIEALENGPGVESKKFINKNKGLKNTLSLIIKKAENTNKYNASFYSSICLSLNTNKHIIFSGKIDGKISNEIRGENGFGYDPIFIPNGYKKTFAEMTMSEKNNISHRYIAIKKLLLYLEKLI